jgi:maleate isomerase
MQATFAPNVVLTQQPVVLEPTDAWKRLGLITLATDLTSERDFARIVPLEQAGVYGTRIEFENPTTPENLARMAPRLTRAAELILPGEHLEAICYSCTAASVVIGEDDIADAIHAVQPGVPVVTPTVAARLALTALGATRISVLTPYLVETGQPMATYFANHGLEVTRFVCLGLSDDRIMARVSRKTIVEAACLADRPETEALFISCTGLPAVSAIAEIESRTGKPVITSNQASAWAMMRHAGMKDRLDGFGRLFERDLPLSNNGAAA